MSVIEAIAALRDRAALQKLHPGEPWLWRRDWAERQVRDTARVPVGCLWAFSVIWILFTIPASLAVLQKVQEQPFIWFFALFPLAGVFLMLFAGYHTLRRYKYGTSICRIDRVPLAMGHPLRGEVIARVRQMPPEGFQLQFACIRRVTTGSGKNRSTHEEVIWQDDQRMHPGAIAPNPDGVRIPFTFQIPSDAEPCDDSQPNVTVLWRLTVIAEVPGVDYRADFELPVYRVDEEGSDPAPLFATTPTIAFEPSPHSGIRTELSPTGSESIVIAPPSRFGDWFGYLMFFALWFGILGAIEHFADPPWPAKAFLGIFFAVGALVFFAALDFLLGRSTLRADRSTLITRRRWLLFSRERTFSAADVETILPKVGMTSNGRAFYDLQLVQRNGRTTNIAKYFRERRDAEMVAARLRRALGR